MNASTAHSTRPAPTHTVTLLDTSNSDTIHDVGIQDSTTGPHTRSTTSTWNGGSQRELTVKELSGKRGAHQTPSAGLQGGVCAGLDHHCRIDLGQSNFVRLPAPPPGPDLVRPRMISSVGPLEPFADVDAVAVVGLDLDEPATLMRRRSVEDDVD